MSVLQSQLSIAMFCFLGILTTNIGEAAAQPKCKSTFECAQLAVESAAKSEAQVGALQKRVADLETALSASVDTKSNPNCVRHYETQICWGEAKVQPEQNVTGSNIHYFAAQFPLEFLGTPIINHSILVNYPNTGPAYTVYVYDADNKGWHGAMIRLRPDGTNNVKLIYTAIGKWK